MYVSVSVSVSALVSVSESASPWPAFLFLPVSQSAKHSPSLSTTTPPTHTQHHTVADLIKHSELAVCHVSCHVPVRDTGHGLCEVCEFVEVRREEARGLELLCNVLWGLGSRCWGSAFAFRFRVSPLPTTHPRTHAHQHTHTHKHTHTNTHTQTYTHKHIHTPYNHSKMH